MDRIRVLDIIINKFDTEYIAFNHSYRYHGCRRDNCLLFALFWEEEMEKYKLSVRHTYTHSYTH